MSKAERDVPREKGSVPEDLRQRIIEAARDIVSEQGLEGLSMRALALRIGHSPGTIYLHFQDKEELLRTVMEEGFRRLSECMRQEIRSAGPGATHLEQYAATGRGYARFAVDHTGYFKVMFKLPRVAQLEDCPELPGAPHSDEYESSRDYGVSLLRRAVQAGQAEMEDPAREWAIGWGLVHGLTSLYVSGHLRDQAANHEQFMELIERGIQVLGCGWRSGTEEPERESGR